MHLNYSHLLLQIFGIKVTCHRALDPQEVEYCQFSHTNNADIVRLRVYFSTLSNIGR